MTLPCPPHPMIRLLILAPSWAFDLAQGASNSNSKAGACVNQARVSGIINECTDLFIERPKVPTSDNMLPSGISSPDQPPELPFLFPWRACQIRVLR